MNDPPPGATSGSGASAGHGADGGVVSGAGGATSSAGGAKSATGGATGASGGAAPSAGAGASSDPAAGGVPHSVHAVFSSGPCAMKAGDWCQEWLTGSPDSDYKIALNSAGRVIVAGVRADDNVGVAEYTPNGELVWSQAFSAGSWEFAEGLTTDASDAVFVSGSTRDEATSVSTPFLAKLSPDGDVLWLKRPGSSSTTGGVATDADGNAVLAIPEVMEYSARADLLWTFTQSDTIATGPITVNADGEVLFVRNDATNTYLTSLSPGGALLSDRRFAASDPAVAHAAFDPNGDLLVLSSGGAPGKWLLWRYSPEDDLVWSVVLTPSLFTADAVALDASRNIYVVGMANDFGEPYYDTYVAKYDPDGNLLGGTLLGERGGASWRDLAVSGDGVVFVAGTSASGAFVARAPSP